MAFYLIAIAVAASSCIVVLSSWRGTVEAGISKGTVETSRAVLSFLP